MITHKGPATTGGWQCITTEWPLNATLTPTYIEAAVRANPDPGHTGVAMGLVGHVPEGSETFKILFDDGCLYSAGNGLVGKAHNLDHTVELKKTFEVGTTFGFQYHCEKKNAPPKVSWYRNGACIGQCHIKEANKNVAFYPVFFLFTRNAELEVSFDKPTPGTRK